MEILGWIFLIYLIFGIVISAFITFNFWLDEQLMYGVTKWGKLITLFLVLILGWPFYFAIEYL